jgi:carbamate kinase
MLLYISLPLVSCIFYRFTPDSSHMKIVVALGGNAILRRGERGTAEEQFAHVRTAVAELSTLVADGHELVITHGNGPQVGDILLKNECALDSLPRMPLDVCGAESQGMIGYMIQQSMENELARRGIRRRVISLVTQTLVDPADPAFFAPSKPVGPFYTAEEARSADPAWHVGEVETAGGILYRRMVPSPDPLEVIEHSSIQTLFTGGFIVVAAGGGGIPVFRTPDGDLAGVEAVVDKDLAAERLATGVGAELLLILTDIEGIYLGFGTEDQRMLSSMTAAEAEAHLRAGEFAEGSMAPKVKACVRFAREGNGRSAVTSLEHAKKAVEGRAGTTVTPG